nr:hypothetical protein [Tanacetum cinerariifolium]
MGKSSNLSVSQVDEASKKDLEDLFQDFYDEYFDSSKIMKSSRRKGILECLLVIQKSLLLSEFTTNELGKSSNLSVSQVDEASKKDLEDLFQNFYDEYFDSSKS